jgi:hypothetical protein
MWPTLLHICYISPAAARAHPVPDPRTKGIAGAAKTALVLRGNRLLGLIIFNDGQTRHSFPPNAFASQKTQPFARPQT